MVDARANGAFSTVAVVPSPAISGTSLTLATGDGARFPVGTFDVEIWDSAAIRPVYVAGSGSVNAEIATATRTGGSDVLNLVRAAQGSTARTIAIGDNVALGPTAGLIDQIVAAIDAAGQPLFMHVFTR